MKKIASVILLAGWFIGSYATDARVFTMGGNDNFFMDDYSIFRNPANVSYYPNMLIGSPGVYVDPTDSSKKNTNPINPYFGPILSYSLSQSTESGAQYPLLSMGLILNRHDDMLDYLNPAASLCQATHVVRTFQNFNSNANVLAPVGKIDFMLGYAMQNGLMIGVGGYFAFQSKDTLTNSLVTGVYRGNVGVNYPIAKSMNLEASVGITSLTAIALDTVAGNSRTLDTIADNNISVRGDVRVFSALTALNGDLVPHLGVNYVSLNKYSNLDISAGLGVNVNIDKGFFWAGVEGLYNAQAFNDLTKGDSLPSGVGGRISAGLERNVIFDWWVWRIGVSKQLMYVTDGNSNSHWEENPESNGSNKDCFSLGWGLNIENRLKIDAVMAEDMFYTWTNLVSGNASHLTNRITATYSF